MSSALFKGQAAAIGAGQRTVGEEELTLVWVEVGREFQRLLGRHQRVHPAAHDRQVRQDWTTLHVCSALPSAVRCP